MQNTEPPPESPYKFLDYYRKKDRDIFFGRKAETRVLLSDVSVTRLVVLFAKTGTGKTSLINAGVRPILEERGYATFFIRVKRDPIESARKAIVEPDPDDPQAPDSQAPDPDHPEAPDPDGPEATDPDDPQAPVRRLVWPEGKGFAECLEDVARQLKKKIVLFFDQFEEFFIYPLDEGALPAAEAEAERVRDREEQMRRRQEFIAAVAAIYHDKESRVHLVFSMREEWFVELDMFRDLIPNIFHNDSNLRLRWFSRSQARDAIRLPAEKFEVTVADDVVERLIADLSDNGKTEIEPAQLQIVCDTLWWGGVGDSITLTDYERLGKLDDAAGAAPGAQRESIARRILFKRLGREFEEIKDDEQLQLLYALLPKLGTPWGTKYVRDINGLVKELTSDDPALREVVTDDLAYQALVEGLRRGAAPLRALLARLEKSIGFVRMGMRDNLEVVELSHDYLVGHLSELQARVRAIPMRRTLEKVMGRKGLPATPEEVELISNSLGLLKPSKPQAAKMLRSALSHGLDSYTGLWFVLAGERRAWAVVRKSLKEIETSSYVIRFLADLGDARAVALLEGVLGDESLASYTIEIVSRKESDWVIDFLLRAARRPELFRTAYEALRRVGETARDASVAGRARRELALLEEAGRGARPRGGAAAEDYSRGAEEFERLSADSLAPHFKAVVKSLGEGRLTLFLGADVSHAGGAWEPGATLPSAQELAAHLGARFRYPPGSPDACDLARVSQYAADTASDPGELYGALREVFAAEPEPPRLHTLLPRLASRAYDSAPAGTLILSTAYDDLLERAFKRQRVRFHLLSYLARGEQAGKFLHLTPEGAAVPIDVPLEYQKLTGGLPVIIKVCGGVNRERAEYDSFVITEDDYIEQLTLSDVVSLLPLTLAARMRRSSFLFLGCSPRDWNTRVLLRRIWTRQRPGSQSWAIRAGHDSIERALWRERNVEPFGIPLDSYADELEKHVGRKSQEV